MLLSHWCMEATHNEWLPGNGSTVKDALATLEPSVRKRVKTVVNNIGSAKTTPYRLWGEGAWQYNYGRGVVAYLFIVGA